MTSTDSTKSEKVQKAIDDAPDGWTICGNYRAVTDLIWPRADTLIWLDYSMTIVFARVWRRTIFRSLRREVLWGGCRENLWMQFFTKDSLFLWVINTWRRYRRDYPKVLRSDCCRHLHIVRLRSPQETERWLDRGGPARA